MNGNQDSLLKIFLIEYLDISLNKFTVKIKNQFIFI